MLMKKRKSKAEASRSPATTSRSLFTSADGFYCNLSSLCTKSRATHKEFSIFSGEDAVSTEGKSPVCVCLPLSFALSLFFEIQPIITLEGSVSHTFQRAGNNKVTLQVASGGAIVQDSRDITVKGESGRRRSSKCCNWRDARGWHEYATRRASQAGRRPVHSSGGAKSKSATTCS